MVQLSPTTAPTYIPTSCIQQYNKGLSNTIFIIMRQNAHFETTIPTIEDKNSKIVVEASENMWYDQKQRRIQGNTIIHNAKNITLLFNNEMIAFLSIGTSKTIFALYYN